MGMRCLSGRPATRLGLLAMLLAAATMLPPTAHAVRASKRDGATATNGTNATGGPAGDTAEEARIDYQANDLLKKGLELLEQQQDERALKLIASVPRLFPKSKVRFQASMALGKYYASKQNYDQAIAQFQPLGDAEDPNVQAEGLYQTGICYFFLNNHDKAFMALRRVTNDFAGSVFANEAYYYIGQCHFKQGRWAKAIEALEMVGTSVADDGSVEGPARAESGQRLYVKVHDQDLVVLKDQQKQLALTVTAKSGDKESIRLEALGKSGEYYIGSVPTMPGDPTPGDGFLQVTGGDLAAVGYVDENTESGQGRQKRLAEVEIVSTASIGFTDGAYREYTHGIFADQESFLRVKDLDRDVSAQPDTLAVRVSSERREGRDKDKDETADGDTGEEAAKWVTRATVEVTLRETGPRTGIFTGSLVPRLLAGDADAKAAPGELPVGKGDEVVLAYTDDKSMLGAGPREVACRAKLLVGQIQDVRIENRVVDSLELKARKNLIEAKLFLKLGQIFKDVGLTRNASDKAAEGLARVDEVISTGTKASLDRALLEEAFSVKWELLLVQDKLSEAIGVCQALTRLFPDSVLVDRALLRIGQAKLEANLPEEAIRIFNSIIALQKSQLKAEAQFNIGAALEKMALVRAPKEGQADLSQAMLAYKKCADGYPESPFAGDALDRIASYYINIKDYPRAIELMERVFQDYPDASFLDKMLFKWVVAAYRMSNYAGAKSKAEQLLSEYPNSPLAEKTRQFLDTIQKKL